MPAGIMRLGVNNKQGAMAMKGLILKGPNELVLSDVDEPSPALGEVVIDVEITGIGGSESAALRNPGMRPLPNIMGHSICGVTASGQRVAVNPLLGCGQCQYCQEDLAQLCEQWALIGVQKPGGFAEQVSVPERALVELPATLSWEQACFIEPFANSLNAWERAEAKPTDTILIVGAGSLGLGVAAVALQQGFESVQVCENSRTRQAAAEQLGAGPAEASSDLKYDLVFETVGSEATRSLAIERTRKGGKTVFLGFATACSTIDFSRMIREQKTFIGSFVFSPAQFERAIPLARMCQSDWVRSLCFEDVAGALAEFAGGNFNSVKSALRPQRTA